ncbi:MAG: hypothetical protein DYG88_17780 [Chloroflexi bacterium CFX4]|nr:hypothetical protein [Chloroflexi bacterium CFX4]
MVTALNTLPLNQHLQYLRPDMRGVLAGAEGTFWVRYERWAMLRLPVFALNAPSAAEVRRVLRGTCIANYLQTPDEAHPANTVVYLCHNKHYSLEALPSAMRRNVRRGLAQLTIAPLSAQEVMQQGYAAYADTRQRVGLDDYDRQSFEQRFTQRAQSPANTYLGAWHQEKLIAFLSITEVEDWVEFESLFSCTADLVHRPNDTLLYSALRHYLVESPRRVVSYGIRSVQSQSEAGLHQFKLKVGFEALPVHRAFCVHPLLRPFINPFTHRLLVSMAHRMTTNRVIRKAEGFVSLLLGKHTPHQEETGIPND